jgi:hypothetical protein
MYFLSLSNINSRKRLRAHSSEKQRFVFGILNSTKYPQYVPRLFSDLSFENVEFGAVLLIPCDCNSSLFNTSVYTPLCINTREDDLHATQVYLSGISRR